MKKTQTNKRILQGEVVSDKMDKTVVVLVSKYKKHPIYQKYHKVTKRYKAHDEKNQFKVGDIVRIIESRPISKEKRWKVLYK